MKFMVKTQAGHLIACEDFIQTRQLISDGGLWGRLARYETEERATEVFKELELWVRTQIANLNYYNVFSQSEYSLLKEQAIFTFPKE